MENKIKIRIRKAKRKGFNFEYLFTDTKNKTFLESEPKRYMRILAKVGGSFY